MQTKKFVIAFTVMLISLQQLKAQYIKQHTSYRKCFYWKHPIYAWKPKFKK